MGQPGTDIADGRRLPGRHGIEPSGVQRMAAGQTAQRHRRSAQKAMLRDGDRGVLRAGRLKPARAAEAGKRVERRRKHALINKEQRLGRARTPMARSGAAQDLAPAATPAKMRETSRSSWANSISSTLRRGCSTTSTLDGNSERCSRTASRMRRRMRLRSTAPPRTRPVVNPIRGKAPAGSPSGRAR